MKKKEVNDFIKVKQIASPLRRHFSQRATLIGLGLNRSGRVSVLPNTKEVLGMIRKVSHIVVVVKDS